MIRFFDIFFCSVTIALLSPLLVSISILLRFSGEGEIFYFQKRVGKNNKVFNLIKFVTMKKNSEKEGSGTITIKNDPRILPIGKFLRKTKINELPQLFNVMKGEMSLVGPRPLTRKNFEFYEDEIKKKIILIKPGLSGIGSIFFKNEENYLNGQENSEKIYKNYISPYKGKLEIWYSDNINLKNYFFIIFTTIITLLIKKDNLIFKIFPDLPHPDESLLDLFKDE
tara:strand:- start:989 stop:1663 length:675 start_codon:yes stop_codon:yes gene_type:complete